jgi:hypothetical protein
VLGIRFDRLIDQSGTPQVVTLWGKAEDDPTFQKAMHENRVLTVEQPRAEAKKDFGMIGFHPGANTLYLLFPKPLPEEPNAKIIGIKLDLVEQPKALGKVIPIEPKKAEAKKPEPKKAEPKVEPAPAPPPPPKLLTYEVRLVRHATWEKTMKVQAKNAAEAKRQALEQFKDMSLDISESDVEDHVEGLG